MGIYTEEFSLETIDDYCFCIRNFREFLVSYLKSEESHIDYDQNQDNIVTVFENSIQRFYNGLQPSDINILSSIRHVSETIQYNFITFNYTAILDECLSILTNKIPLGRRNYIDGIGEILHIHGTTKEHLIMGVDNASQIKNENITTDKKIERTIIKPYINEKLKMLRNQTGESLVLQSRIICIFGLSLGETDQRWWRMIGEWLKGHDQRRLVLFVKEDEWNLIHPEDSIEKIDEVLEKAFNAMNISPMQSMSNRIHIGFNTEMFKIDLTKKEIDAPLHTSVQVASSSLITS